MAIRPSSGGCRAAFTEPAMGRVTLARRIKNVLIGRARDLEDHSVFHKVSLIAVFAWVGLGADGLSSSCYGPEEAFKALGEYPHLSVFIALAAVATVLIIA